ncbi:MAG: glycerol-3-phosphate dehydrogenase, partial [Bacteroidales bacterium]|nr:glycerol-3-phosphate dehydrogenase [Bacteroidales bacterium]
VIGGPCHAEEVAMQRLTYMTFSCICIDKAHQLANMFNDDFIKTIATTDMHGVELAAVLKNVYAIAIGIAHGMGYGDNFQSVLVAGAYNEMIGYIDSVYPNPERIPGKSAYLGDLIVTCYSQFSRNRTFGNMIGQGYGVVSTQMEMMMVAEGYYSSKAIHHICRKKGINLPIAEAVYNILYEHASLRTTFKMLSDMLK